MKSPVTSAPTARQIYARIKARIDQRRYASGDKLPPLRQIARQFQTTVNMVRQAVDRLQQEQLVVVRHGSGVYVADLSQKTRQVLLLTRTHGDEWSDYAQAITATFSNELSVNLLIESPPEDIHDKPAHARFQQKIHRIIDEGVDVVLFNGMSQTLLRFLDAYADVVPLLCFYSDEAVDGYARGSVVSDWHHGGYAGMRHLIECGCRCVVMTQPRNQPDIHSRELIRGATDAINESIEPVEIISFTASVAEPRDKLRERFSQLLKPPSLPDGIFAHADWLGAFLSNQIQHSGLRVPEDIAVLGYYDTPWAIMTDPPMSSITTQPQVLVEAVKQMYFDQRWGERQIVKPRLVIRESTMRK